MLSREYEQSAARASAHQHIPNAMRDVGEVGDEMNKLRDQISLLEKAVFAMEEKLDTVLAPQQPCAPENDLTGEGYVDAQLSAGIRHARSRITDICKLVESLNARCRL